MFFFLVLHLSIHFSLEKFLKIMEIFPSFHTGKTAIYGNRGGQEVKAFHFCSCVAKPTAFVCVCSFLDSKHGRGLDVS